MSPVPILLGTIAILAGLGALVDFASAILSLVVDSLFNGGLLYAVWRLTVHYQGEIGRLKTENDALRIAAASPATRIAA